MQYYRYIYDIYNLKVLLVTYGYWFSNVVVTYVPIYTYKYKPYYNL